MNKNRTKKIGRRGKIGLAILVAAMFISVASAGLLTHYNKVTTTATLSQSVFVDGKDYTDPITNEYNVTAGDCKSSHHLFESRACVNAPIEFDTQYYNETDIPEGEGINTTYCTPTDYAFKTTIGRQPVLITVTDGDCQITWTIDFPIDDDPCNGLMAVGLIIAQNGEGNGPSFQIHNNDGTDSNYDWGTWLWSPWGPTIKDGWFGWHSGSINVPVSDLDWVECTGGRYHFGKEDDPRPNPDGIFTITIPKCNLGTDFHWALYTAIGQFCNYSYQQAYYPTGFNWGAPIVNMTVPNYELATIMTDLGAGFILGAYQSKEVIICNRFDVGMTQGRYTIISSFVPATTP